MNKGSFHLLQTLQLLLQTLPDLMRGVQRHVPGQHNVHLHQKATAKMKGTHGVNLGDLLVVVQADPGDLAEEPRFGRHPRQHPDLLCDGFKLSVTYPPRALDQKQLSWELGIFTVISALLCVFLHWYIIVCVCVLLSHICRRVLPYKIYHIILMKTSHSVY